MLLKLLGRRAAAPSFALLESHRSVTTTCLLRSKPDKSAMEQEDKDEIERERQLRDRFAQKIQEAMPQYAQTGGGASACGPGGCGQPSPQPTPLFRLFFFATSILFLIVLMQMSDVNSTFNIMQNIPWWQLPISSASYYVLMRALLPYREQWRLKEEYEGAVKQFPSLTLDQFFAQRYPTIFQGQRTQQREVVAAVAACMASANDLKFANTISRAAGSARDVAVSVDGIMDALRREYPYLFQGAPAPPPSYTGAQ